MAERTTAELSTELDALKAEVAYLRDVITPVVDAHKPIPADFVMPNPPGLFPITGQP